MTLRQLNLNMLKAMSLLAALMVALLLATSASNAEEKSRASGPLIELPTQADKCIRPTEFMRRNHMQLLNHKRDQTMRQGVRTQDASLQGCVDCHSKKDDKGVSLPVNGPDQFCSTCHEYVAVKLDCFECHRTTPDVSDSTAQIPDIPAHEQLLANNLTAIKGEEVQNLRSYLEEAK